ncbi:MAG TPA: hypothetical protein VFN30_08680 [Chitinophagaceae bacterium]|nr:hypothetical protein [Chitinophagaceae bacterium]
MTSASISHLTNEHIDWLRALDFYDKEIGFMQTRLAEIASKNDGEEVMKGVEHFQNQFIIQKNNIDELQHDIKINLQQLSHEATNAIGYEIFSLYEHESMREDFMGFEKIMLDLRHEFNHFLSKWM